jgi:hypothetical protein
MFKKKIREEYSWSNPVIETSYFYVLKFPAEVFAA